jgi:hypothetical protein
MTLATTALKTFPHCHFSHHQRDNRGLPSRPRPAAHSSRALHDALPLVHCRLKPRHGQDATLCPNFDGALPEAESLFQALWRGYSLSF